jgi:3-oxoacyl-[acyl-carrier protein] reductase
MDLKAKVIVVTGAAQGLGQKMAETLSNQGANLALADVEQTTLTETIKLCSKPGVVVKGYGADVADEQAVVTLFNTVEKDFGGIDGLINNAGITKDSLLVKVHEGKVVGKMSADDFNKVIAVDLRGVFLCAREAAQHMIDGGRPGVIVNISSISREGNVGQTNYSAAKAGVSAMTVTWSKELAHHHIRVAGIAPGYCDTRMMSTVPPKVLERIISTIPEERLAEPADIADAALFILRNDYFDGRILEMDGGLRI